MGKRVCDSGAAAQPVRDDARSHGVRWSCTGRKAMSVTVTVAGKLIGLSKQASPARSRESASSRTRRSRRPRGRCV